MGASYDCIDYALLGESVPLQETWSHVGYLFGQGTIDYRTVMSHRHLNLVNPNLSKCFMIRCRLGRQFSSLSVQ